MAAVARTRDLDPSDVEVWFADEARVGQKNKITRRWRDVAPGAERGHEALWVEPDIGLIPLLTAAQVVRDMAKVTSLSPSAMRTRQDAALRK